MQCTPEIYAGTYLGANQSFLKEGCETFQDDRPMTMALSVLVIIELLNALNSVSEDQSILSMPPWCNWYLIGADALSLALHFFILYVPFMAELFQLSPLNWTEVSITRCMSAG
jgi:Ca2+ transporting ATPase